MIFDPSKETRPEVLAAEEEYFGCKPCFENGRNRHVFQSGFNAGAASRDAEIAELQRKLANEQARDIHSCHPDCTREGCVNRRLRAELVNALAACKAKDEAILQENYSLALSIQPDDAALKAWLGEPVWVNSEYLGLVKEYGYKKLMVDDEKRGMSDTPLYSPKELK